MVKSLGAAAAIFIFVSTNANAGCTSNSLSSERLGYFIESPGDLLQRFPSGSEMMSFEVTQLATTSITTLKPLQSVFQNTNASQREAIGDGLARAYRICRIKASDQARAIREFGLKSGNSDVALSFTSHSDDSDDDPGRLKPRMADSDLFRSQWNRAAGTAETDSTRSSTYLSGTGGMDMEPNSKKFKLRDPFAPVEILKR